MPATPTCLEALVGLAPTAVSACFPLPDGDTSYLATSSRAGSPGGAVYLSQLSGLDFRPAKAAAADLYDKLAAARTQGAQYVRLGLTTASRFAATTPRFTATGTLGKAGNGSAYAGGAALVLATAYQAGGGYQVSALSLAATVTVAEVPVLLDGVPVAVLASTNVAPQPVAPFVVPFDGQAHTLTAELPPGVLPLTGQLFCTTGCNSRAPGTIGASVARYLPQVTSSTNSAGFVLSVREVCLGDGADLLCYAATPGVNDQLADVLAQAVLGAAAYFYLLDLVTVAEYSRYTLSQPKMMEALATQFKASADQNIAWLAQSGGLARLDNPCFVCAPNPLQPRVVGGRG